MTNRIKFYIKLIVGLGLLILICSYIDINDAFRLMADVKIEYLLLCALVLNFDRFFMAFKWSLLIDYKSKSSVVLASLTKSYYYSVLFSPIVPSTVGEDVVRGVSVLKDGANKEALVSSIVMERLLGAVSQLVLAVLALSLLSMEYSTFDTGYIYWAFSFTFILLALVLFPLLNFSQGLLGKIPITFPDWKIISFIKDTYATYKKYRNKKKRLTVFFLLSLIENTLPIFGFYLFFLSLGIDTTLYKMMLTVPAALFFAKIPISIGGIGVQEGIFILFFSMVGISSEEAMMVSLLSRVVNILAVLPGCLIFYLYDAFIGQEKISI